MFKVNNKNTRMKSLTYFTPFPRVSHVNFELVYVSWAMDQKQYVNSKNSKEHLIDITRFSCI